MSRRSGDSSVIGWLAREEVNLNINSLISNRIGKRTKSWSECDRHRTQTQPLIAMCLEIAISLEERIESPGNVDTKPNAFDAIEKVTKFIGKFSIKVPVTL